MKSVKIPIILKLTAPDYLNACLNVSRIRSEITFTGLDWRSHRRAPTFGSDSCMNESTVRLSAGVFHLRCTSGSGRSRAEQSGPRRPIMVRYWMSRVRSSRWWLVCNLPRSFCSRDMTAQVDPVNITAGPMPMFVAIILMLTHDTVPHRICGLSCATSQQKKLVYLR